VLKLYRNKSFVPIVTAKTPARRNCVKNFLSLLLPLAYALFTTTAFAGPFEGPLIIKNGFPLSAAIGSPSLTSAEPENTLEVSFSYSSTYAVKRSNNWYLGIDLETAMTDIQLKRLVGHATEIGIDIPIIRYGPGFMDGAIETYHDLIGLDNAYGRNNRPHDQFLLNVMHNGNMVIQGEPGKTSFGDMAIEIKHALYNNHASAIVSVQAFVNLPTGEPDSAFGSGRANGGMSVLLNGLIDKLEALQEVTLRNYYYGGVGLEWVYSKSVALNAQLLVQSSPFPKSSIYIIDDPSMLGSFGGRYKVGALASLGIAVTEDVNTAGAPDIMIGTDYRYQF
jgi:hypothetical protein